MTTWDFKLAPKSEWIEVFPFGIVMGANNLRPVMIFKDKSERRVLPVWLSPMDAGIAMSQSNARYQTDAQVMGAPHDIAWQILDHMGITLDRCLFRRVTKNQQYVELHFSTQQKKRKKESQNTVRETVVERSDSTPEAKKGEPQIIEAKADDAISFCLRSGCKFYATLEYIESSRVLETEYVSQSVLVKNNDVPPKYMN